eukprot:4395585-Prymnesium_polylepis.1
MQLLAQTVRRRRHQLPRRDRLGLANRLRLEPQHPGVELSEADAAAFVCVHLGEELVDEAAHRRRALEEGLEAERAERVCELCLREEAVAPLVKVGEELRRRAALKQFQAASRDEVEHSARCPCPHTHTHTYTDTWIRTRTRTRSTSLYLLLQNLADDRSRLAVVSRERTAHPLRAARDVDLAPRLFLRGLVELPRELVEELAHRRTLRVGGRRALELGVRDQPRAVGVELREEHVGRLWWLGLGGGLSRRERERERESMSAAYGGWGWE